MPTKKSLLLIIFCLGGFLCPFTWSQDNIDEQTGLVMDKGVETVKTHCTGCHSAKLITQSRATREGWEAIIRWMQQTQNLWEFDRETETILLDYLAKHYAPETIGRRPNLKVESWYFLETASPPKRSSQQ